MASRRHSNAKMLFYIWINKAWLTVYVEKGHFGGGKVGAGVRLFVIQQYVVCYEMEVTINNEFGPGFM
jgi:hypothetical protein